MKRILSLLAALLFLAGCAGPAAPGAPTPGETPQPARGGYVEVELPLPNYDVQQLKLQPDGTLHLITQPNSPALPLEERVVRWYTMAPGESVWQEQDAAALGWEQVKADVAGMEMASCQIQCHMDDDGALYWYVRGWEQLFSNSERYYRVQNGAAESLDAKDLPFALQTLWAPVRGMGGQVVCDGTLICADLDGVLHAYDENGGQLNLDLPIWTSGDRMLGSWQNAWYFWDKDLHLKRCILGGTTAETVMNGSRYSIAATNMPLQASAVGPNGTLYMVVGRYFYGDEDSELHLFRYTWDPTLEPDDGDTLRVFSLYRSESVASAVVELQRTAGCTVEYTYMLEGTFPRLDKDALTNARTDALRQLNTALLAGQGPDLLILDDMNLAAFRRQGLLADLTDLVDTGGMLPNIADAYRDAEGLWAVATRCIPYLLGGAAEDIAGIDTLDELVKRIEQSTPPPTPTPAPATGVGVIISAESNGLVLDFGRWYDLFEMTYPLYAEDLWKDGTLDTELWRNYLSTLRRVAEKAGVDAMRSRFEEGREYEAMTGYYLTNSKVTTNFGNVLSHKLVFGPMGTPYAMGYFTWRSEITGAANAGELVAATGEAGRTAVELRVVAGVNAASEQKELAARFIGTLLSRDIQYLDNASEGMPVDRAELAAQAQAALDEVGAATVTHTDLAEVVAGLRPVTLVRELRDAAWAGAFAYYDNWDPDAAANAARDAAALWLAEQ